jgi:hypothetical protein
MDVLYRLNLLLPVESVLQTSKVLVFKRSENSQPSKTLMDGQERSYKRSGTVNGMKRGTIRNGERPGTPRNVRV